MPPRGAKRPGLTRMDAALDALGQMGFPRKKVRRTVNHLIKEVYGEEGWVFVEENSYRVVIDALLEEQESKAAEPTELVEGEGAESVKALDISEFSGGISEFSEGTELQSPSGSVCAGNVLELRRNVEHGNAQSRRRRPPCYGWISEDEDEVDATVVPSTVESQAVVHCLHSGNRDRKRQHRWDVKPHGGD